MRAGAGKPQAFIPAPAAWALSLTVVIFAALAGLAMAASLAWSVLALDEGTPDMQEVSHAIREGANGFLKQQYQTIGRLAVVVQAVLFLFYLSRPPPPSLGTPDMQEVSHAIREGANGFL